MLGLMKFKKLFWKKSDEHDKLDELDHEFIAGFTKREIIRMIQNMSDEELEKALVSMYLYDFNQKFKDHKNGAVALNN